MRSTLATPTWPATGWCEETDPTTLVQETVETARFHQSARGLALRTEIEPDLPRLWVDPTRIRQVL